MILLILDTKEDRVGDPKIENGMGSSTTDPKRNKTVQKYKQKIGNESNK